MYFSITFLMIVFLSMSKNVNIKKKNICTCKVVVFSFFQPNCNKVFCFLYTDAPPPLFLATLTGKYRHLETEKLLKAGLM